MVCCHSRSSRYSQLNDLIDDSDIVELIKISFALHALTLRVDRHSVVVEMSDQVSKVQRT